MTITPSGVENEDLVEEQISWNSFANMARCLSYSPEGKSEIGGLLNSVSHIHISSLLLFPKRHYIAFKYMQLLVRINTFNFDYWMISMHEKGHFMPGLSRLYGNDIICEPRRTGLTKRSFYLELAQTTYLNKADTPCQSSGGYLPVSRCIDDYIVKKLKCREIIAFSISHYHYPRRVLFPTGAGRK